MKITKPKRKAVKRRSAAKTDFLDRDPRVWEEEPIEEEEPQESQAMIRQPEAFTAEENLQLQRLLAKKFSSARAHRKPRDAKFSLEAQEIIVNALRMGLDVDAAATLCELEAEDVHAWLKAAKAAMERVKRLQGMKAEGAALSKQEHRQLYYNNTEAALVGFYHAVKKAVSQLQLRDLLTIDQAASEGAWQAAAWRLERAFNKWVAPRDRPEVNSGAPAVTGYAYIEVAGPGAAGKETLEDQIKRMASEHGISVEGIMEQFKGLLERKVSEMQLEELDKMEGPLQ